MRNRIARSAVLLLVLSASAPLVAQTAPSAKKPAATAAKAVTATVYLTPTCGCCGKWVEHLEAAKIVVKREVTTNLDAVPARTRVPSQLRSCHTAVIGDYLVEGHVPVDVIQKMLKERPKIAGIAVPGMPTGSPGMEGPNPRPYSIVAFRADGTTFEFARR
ncbi:MAG TPA: DUF411 domain-containing protein [Vicinamibacterales bacterium]|nr:DUF411 domain-containing protein [Vicinamibacterales bacterium]